MEKPNMNYAVAYQRFRSELNGQIIQLQKEYPIPTYMVEGILACILADIRSAAIGETVLEEKSYGEELKNYYENTINELNDEILKAKAEKEKSDE